MSRKTRLSLGIAILAGVLGGGNALANPMALDVMRVQQVPLTQHVQLTYGYDANYGGDATVVSVKRDGVELDKQWSEYSGFQANTGSGVTSLNAQQTCDCDVPEGEHTYLVTIQPAEGDPQDRTASILVVANLQVPVDAGAPAGDLALWDIPDPSEIQGLDCSQFCSDEPPADSGVVVDQGVSKDSGPVTNPDAAVTADGSAAQDSGQALEKKDDDSGCALSGSSSVGTPLMLAAVALLLLFRRRRS